MPPFLRNNQQKIEHSHPHQELNTNNEILEIQDVLPNDIELSDFSNSVSDSSQPGFQVTKSGNKNGKGSERSRAAQDKFNTNTLTPKVGNLIDQRVIQLCKQSVYDSIYNNNSV